MLTIQEVRDTLPNKGEDLSDEEVAEIRDKMYELGNIIFDEWLMDRNQKMKVTAPDQISPSPETPV